MIFGGVVGNSLEIVSCLNRPADAHQTVIALIDSTEDLGAIEEPIDALPAAR